jgi:hypothetical protein
MINIFFDNFYYKLCFAIILCLLIAFADRIDVLKNGGIVLIILFLIILMMNAQEDYGIVILLVALFVLGYNNVTFKPSKQKS